MRVITGSARGRRLKTLEGNDVRPTSEKTKEAIFSVIQFDIEGRRVLDLFAGSGQLGIEAISRGAESAVFVDASAASLDVVNDNIKTTGFQRQAKTVRSDSLRFLESTSERFDIAFIDPPYAKGLLQSALGKIDRVMSDSGIIICEHPSDEVLDETVGRFSVSRVYRYSKTSVTVYRRGDS